ncbi:hypothetical protein VFPFJ_03117 [Purpureocillium lilacinum]|uniref:Uncharacterized protein n=1 Tax=Purpureocillium lilacinum TaxID=33203 RepID=A0A179HM43_PURLI|nr:hypothetical protein VFPFJ_03117 [Purpureocillium lilacinum]OAQ91377.1 hypothetical protein VFPFJ_03117 [Purpureocillium lilacinum]
MSCEIVTGPRAVASASPPQGGGDRSVRGEWTAALSVRLAADGRAGIFSDSSRWEGLLSPWNLPSPPLAFLALGHAPRRLADDSLDSGTPVNTRGIKAGIHCFFHSFVKRRPSGFAVRDRLREAASGQGGVGGDPLAGEAEAGSSTRGGPGGSRDAEARHGGPWITALGELGAMQMPSRVARQMKDMDRQTSRTQAPPGCG